MDAKVRKAKSSTLTEYLGEVRRLVQLRRLPEAEVEALMTQERNYLVEMFEERGSEDEAAEEITRQASAGVPLAQVLNVALSPKAFQYLEELVALGLWGSTPEDVAAIFICRQIEAKALGGFIPLSKPR